MEPNLQTQQTIRKEQMEEKSEELSFANRVLLQLPNRSEKKYIIYIPTYLRIFISSFKEISLQNLCGQFKATIKFDIDVTDLPNTLVDYIQEKIRLNFHQEQKFLRLSQIDQEGEIKKRNYYEHRKSKSGKKRTLIGYRFDKLVSARMIPDIYLTPFQKLYLILSITVQHINIWKQQEMQKFQDIIKTGLTERDRQSVEYQNYSLDYLSIRFNFMDFNYCKWYVEDGILKDYQIRIGYSEETYFGLYDLAEKYLNVQYTNQQQCRRLKNQCEKRNQNIKFCYKFFQNCFCCNCKSKREEDEEEKELLQHSKIKQQNQKKQSKKVHPFRIAHFEIPLYKDPIVSLITIFLPIWLVGWVSIAIFFQESEFEGRIANIATIMLAYLAFMPVVREQLPPNPKITFIQILIYLQIGGTMLCLIESFLLRNEGCQGSSDPSQLCSYNRSQNAALWIAFTIQIAQILIIFFLVARYYCYSLPKYNIIKGLDILLNPFQWSNKDCDKYFQDEVIKNKRIKIVEFNQASLDLDEKEEGDDDVLKFQIAGNSKNKFLIDLKKLK